MSTPETVVRVEKVVKTFKIPTESSNGIKQKLINVLKGKRGYREFTPLKGISFEVNEGEFFGIVGRNGSGKSTLLKTIANIYTPTSGQVGVKGKLVPFIELGVGFNPELTGRENVFLNGALLGFSRDEIKAMYDEIVDFAEIRDFMDEKLKNYSSGMQVRLAFSIAIKAEGDILLLDEVLAVGDEAFQRKCFDYFEKLKNEKKTVILVTHDMGAVQRFCTRAMMIEDGKIKKIGKPIDVADIYREDNIESSAHQAKGDDKKSGIEVIVGHKSDDLAELRFIYEKQQDDVYVGFTIFKDGTNIAEINSLSIDNHNPVYQLDMSTLNPGNYEISATLFKRSNRAPIAATAQRSHLIIKGFDDQRGGGMKLPNEWTNVE